MSKLLKRDNIGEDNSFHISLIAASLDAIAVAAVEAAGLTLASTKVIDSADEDLIFNFGRGAIGSPTADYMTIAHRDRLNTTQYALAQLPDGTTLLNTRSGYAIHFRHGAVTKMRLNLTNLIMSVPIAMGTNKITGLGDPADDQDAATKKWVTDNFVAK